MSQRVLVAHHDQTIAAELVDSLASHGIAGEIFELRDGTIFDVDPPAAVLFDFRNSQRGAGLVKTCGEQGIIVGVLTAAFETDSRVLLEMGADLVLSTNTPTKWIVSSLVRHLQEKTARELDG